MIQNTNIRTGPAYLAAILAVFMIIFSSCDRTRNDKGYEYFPDMAHSWPYDTYSENPVYEDGKTAQPVPEGTVPRDEIPYQYPGSFEGRELAAKELKNPFEPTAKLIKRGKEQYDIFCVNCHGPEGKGNGNLHTSGLYIIKPKSLVNDKMKNEVTDGEIFHVITRGWGVMGAHGAQIDPDDRWAIVNYIREELQANSDNQ
ncbi:MAG: cytochrome c [Bacteroidales bacterium]|nr:cytochrome c [Bacteroidales bacterium]